MNTIAGVIGIVLLGVLFMLLGPIIVALSLGELFSLPFWPSFWLAFGVGMLAGGTKISASK